MCWILYGISIGISLGAVIISFKNIIEIGKLRSKIKIMKVETDFYRDRYCSLIALLKRSQSTHSVTEPDL
jgi:hypothetical protein